MMMMVQKMQDNQKKGTMDEDDKKLLQKVEALMAQNLADKLSGGSFLKKPVE